MPVTDLFASIGRIDWTAIAYSFVASVLFALVVRWLHLWSAFRRLLSRRRGMRRYRRELRQECEHLIVVGRRAGFSMKSTFVEMDIAKSDLMRKSGDEDAEHHLWSGAVVIVGGPGAGKSTVVKHRLLRTLDRFGAPAPLFLRLRDYVGFDSIEAALVHRLRSAGIGDADETLARILQTPSFLCVLDGLDEVKQDHRPHVVSDINAFFHKRCQRGASLIVTCRKEAYRDTPLDIPTILEVRPLSDSQIQQFAKNWPLGYPQGKSAETFWRDLSSTPKIHELARSPLLLVGGLMQYTESNQGIPGERYQYLQRVASWLIADWSTAQGHPPDPLRPLYDRILPRLAIEMHERKVAELDLAAAQQLITTWLPLFGFADREASAVVDSIRTRTGILVVDDRHRLVFAQFGLQEFFASLEITQRVSPAAMAQLTPVPWWRETILLAVAQQRDPSTWLDALFAANPFLATAAVAECPTPSDAQQRRAVSASIVGIDKADESITGSLVPLLRKVRGAFEEQLCSELERRLTDRRKRARIVGLALATAGTQAATEVLARHPEIWAECLASAGYLSASFETLLLGWVEAGSDEQSAHAANMLVHRLRGEVLDRLLGLLPRLSSKKANHVASVLLAQMAAEPADPTDFGVTIGMSRMSQCAAYVLDPRQFVEAYSRRMTDPAGGARSRYRRLYSDPRGPGPVLTALLLYADDKKRRLAHNIEARLNASIAWRVDRDLILGCLIGAGFLTDSTAQGVIGKVLLGALLLGVILIAGTGLAPLPWQASIRKFHWGRETDRIQIALVSMCTALAMTAELRGEYATFLPFAGASVILLGWVSSSNTSARHWFTRFDIQSPTLHRLISRIGIGLSVLIVAAQASLLKWQPAYTGLFTRTVGAVLFVLSFTTASYLLHSFYLVRTAADQATALLLEEVEPRAVTQGLGGFVSRILG